MTRPPGPDDPDADAPEWWRRSRDLRRIPVVAVIVIVVIIVVAINRAGTPPPPIRKSCTTPAFTLSTYSVKQGGELGWSLTGQPGHIYQLTVGIARIETQGGHLHAVPEKRTGTHTVLTSQQVKLDSQCLAHGAFGAAVDPGRYPVRMFELIGPQSDPTATQVDARTLTVTGS